MPVATRAVGRRRRRPPADRTPRRYSRSVPNRLTLTVVPPEASTWNQVELCFLVDGRDIIRSVFDPGPAADPDEVLGPNSPLLPGDRPHEVRLAEASCTEYCCGALYVRIRREGDEVVWDQWRNPDAEDVDLAVLRFDAQQYQAELARADADRRWEWPGRTVARLLRQALGLEPDLMQRWNSSLDFVQCWPRERDVVQVVFTSPPMQAVAEFARLFDRPMEYKQYRLRVPVTDEAAADQTAQAITALRDNDPRDSAEICGGYGARR
jgi:hypothetical protein